MYAAVVDTSTSTRHTGASHEFEHAVAARAWGSMTDMGASGGEDTAGEAPGTRVITLSMGAYATVAAST